MMPKESVPIEREPHTDGIKYNNKKKKNECNSTVAPCPNGDILCAEAILYRRCEELKVQVWERTTFFVVIVVTSYYSLIRRLAT